MTVEIKRPVEGAQDVDPRLRIAASTIIARFRLKHGIPPLDAGPPIISLSIEIGGVNNRKRAEFTRDESGQETLTMKVEQPSLPTSFATIKAHPTNVLDGKFELSHATHRVPSRDGSPSSGIVKSKSIDETARLINAMAAFFSLRKSNKSI